MGGWAIPLESPMRFWLPPDPGCGGRSLMHASAEPKRYVERFVFRAPPAGTGPITFRALVKQGETNRGAFYWMGEPSPRPAPGPLPLCQCQHTQTHTHTHAAASVPALAVSRPFLAGCIHPRPSHLVLHTQLPGTCRIGDGVNEMGGEAPGYRVSGGDLVLAEALPPSTPASSPLWLQSSVGESCTSVCASVGYL